MQWRHAGQFKHDQAKLADYAFFSIPHVRDTIEGLILAYYELLYMCLCKIDKRNVSV
jgi:hypothetical protein